ncbi:tripartite motif-containing protein 16-like [Fundulus diaphanus]
MEQNQLDRETFSCSICLDLLKDPVTIPCGHSYCMKCIKAHWDEEDQKGIHSCPECRETFIPRPALKKNTMLAALVEQLKKTGLQAPPADLCYAGPEDVACDVCTGRKLKAIKSCLACPASYCEKHLQPHYDSAPLKKHKLVEPSRNLQENICSRHDEVMKMFCRTDQKCICLICLMDDHKGHDTVPAAAERTERQRELEVRRENIQQRIQDREKDVKLLQQEMEAINRSADKTVEDSEKIFTQLIRLIQKRRSEVKQQIRSQQETEGSRVKELQEKLEQEITELKRKDTDLKQLSDTEDHNQFLHNYPSLSALSESTHSSSIKIRPLSYFEDVTAAVSELRDKLQDILREQPLAEPTRLPSAAEPLSQSVDSIAPAATSCPVPCSVVRSPQTNGAKLSTAPPCDAPSSDQAPPCRPNLSPEPNGLAPGRRFRASAARRASPSWRSPAPPHILVCPYYARFWASGIRP